MSRGSRHSARGTSGRCPGGSTENYVALRVAPSGCQGSVVGSSWVAVVDRCGWGATRRSVGAPCRVVSDNPLGVRSGAITWPPKSEDGALGTAGGPRWWEGPNAGQRSGISTAVVVGDAVYLVDCGYGAGRQLQLSQAPFTDLRGIFLTHMHSDHIVDLPAIVMFGIVNLTKATTGPIPIIGPGRRGKLPPVSPHAVTAPEPVAPDAPGPGTRDLFDHIVKGFATDSTTGSSTP